MGAKQVAKASCSVVVRVLQSWLKEEKEGQGYKSCLESMVFVQKVSVIARRYPYPTRVQTLKQKKISRSSRSRTWLRYYLMLEDTDKPIERGCMYLLPLGLGISVTTGARLGRQLWRQGRRRGSEGDNGRSEGGRWVRNLRQSSLWIFAGRGNVGLDSKERYAV